MMEFYGVIKVSTSIFLLQTIYCFAFFDGVLDKTLLAALASSAGYLLGISMGLSSAVHYLGLPNVYLKYRRHLGVTGFLYALIYSIALLAISPQSYLNEFPFRLFTAINLLGIFSMAVLAVMALLSNNFAISFLGFKCWKNIMGLGYWAYFSLVLRASLIEADVWLSWIITPTTLPPPRLLLSVFAIAVIVLGLSRQVKAKRPLQVFQS